MPREITALPTATNPHVAALAFLATVAYPDSTADRDKFLDAGRAWILRQLPAGDERDALAARLPAIRPRDIDARLQRAFKIIRSRRRWAAAEVQQELFRASPGKIGRKRRLEAFGRLSFRNTDGSNAHRLIWRESLPVVHLAYVLQFGEALADWRAECLPAALDVRSERSRLQNERNRFLVLARERRSPVTLRLRLRFDYGKSTGGMDPFSLIARPDWVAAAIAEAESVRRHLLALGTVTDDQTITFLSST